MIRPRLLTTAVAGTAAAAAVLLGALSPAAAASTAWVGNQHAAVRLLTATDDVSGASSVEAGLAFRFAPGWHGYWRTPGDAGIAPVLDWSGTPGLTSATVFWPAPTRLVISGLQNSTYEGNVVLPVRLAFSDPKKPADIHVTVDYAACSNVCVPYHADLVLSLPVGSGTASDEAGAIAAARAAVPAAPSAAGIEVLRQAVVGNGAERALVVDLRSDTVPFSHPDLFVEHAGDGIPPAPSVFLSDDNRSAILTVPLADAPAETPFDLTLVDLGRSAEFIGPAAAAPVVETSGLWAILLSALIGGLILNLMPCVLPVLSLKFAGLTRVAEAGEDPRSRWRAVRVGFAATGFGIVSCFLGIAAVLVGLKWSGATLGWGIQFQQPWFLAGMALVTVLFAASLFDWLHIGIPQWAVRLSEAGSALRGRDRSQVPRGPAVEAFLTGAFATLLATPCSAPFVGTAVGFALARGPAEILGIFFCLGIGMGLPFFGAALVPGIARWLPRPGPWMITLRRVLGIMLLGTAAWLVVILWSVSGPGATFWVVLLLAGLLALTCWTRLGGRGEGQLWPKLAMGALSILVVVAAVASPAADPMSERDAGDWQRFDPAALDRLVADGKTVLVDVSASWCLTCRVNELAALKTAEVRGRLSQPDTVTMRADWSRPDPSIARYIQSFARYGIPLDVVYGPGRPAGEALPELLTAGLVVHALDRAAGAERRAGGVP